MGERRSRPQPRIVADDATRIPDMQHPQWRGQVTIGRGWATYRGAAGDSRTHRHPAVQVIVRHAERPTVEVDGAALTIGHAACLPGGIPHRLRPIGDVGLVFLDAGSPVGRVLARRCGERPLRLSTGEASTLRRLIELGDGDRICAALGRGDLRAEPSRPGSVTRLFQAYQGLADGAPLPSRVRDWARQVALSEDQLARVLRRETGWPPRGLLRWLRMQRAMEWMLAGASATEAAHAAGFADGAHFTRTVRMHFGVAPTALLGLQRLR